MRTIDASLVLAWMNIAADDLHDACPALTDLDAARGDADHGVNMERGFRAIASALTADPPASAGQCLTVAAAVLRKTMGGTTGPLWATALRRAGKTLSAQEPNEPATLALSLFAAADAVAEIGGAKEGDNTMLDALYPAARAMKSALDAGMNLATSVTAASTAAAEGAAGTAHRIATKGRASYLGQRGVGHADPGATSAAIVVHALCWAVTPPTKN